MNTKTFCYTIFFVTGDVLLRRRFVTGDVLLRRCFVEETFCYGDVLLGDVLSRRRFVRRRFVCASSKRIIIVNQRASSFSLAGNCIYNMSNERRL
jgi:hypothetical protein